MSIVFWLLALAIVAIVSFVGGICAVLYWAVPRIERGYVFRPSPIISKTPADLGIPFEQHFITTPDGCRLSAWHMCPPSPQGSVVYFHGNGANMGILNEIFALLYRHGLQVMAVDYRGYGLSSGTPSESGLRIDAQSSVQYFIDRLKPRGIPLIYWGRSLGACFAAYAASRRPPQGLILETAFPSKASLVRHYPQFRRFLPFSRIRLNTAACLKDHQFPVLLVHGDLDKTVPLEEGRRLYQLLSGPKEFFHVKGADHINLHLIDSSAYMTRVLDFVRRTQSPTVH